MPKTSIKEVLLEENKQHFDKEKIYDAEPGYIDIYRNNDAKKQPLKVLFKLYKGHYMKIILSAVFNILQTSPLWVIPLVSTDIINTIVEHPDNLARKLIIDAVIAAIFLLQNIPTTILCGHFSSLANRSVEAGLRGAMIRKLQQLSISFHKDMASGKIQSKVMRDVESVTDLTRSIFSAVVSTGVQVTVSLIIVLTHNIFVFLMFLICVPIAVFINRKFRGSMRKRSHLFRKEVERTSASVFDMQELIPVTRAHALENEEIVKLTDEVTDIAEEGYRLERLGNTFGAANWVSVQLIQVICLFFTATMAYNKFITVGEISLYQSYFGTLVGGVSAFINLLPIISRGSEALSSIGEVLSAYDIEDNTDKEKIGDLKGEYELRNVSFSYDEQTHVLEGLNLKVNPGETVALVGESGSGKSTVINLVIGFNKATKGEVMIDGKNINDIDLRSYRKMISIVPQNSILFSGTIRENITYGLKSISEEKLKEVIKMAQLESVIEKLPYGLDTLVGEHGGKLSGGQKQRISIARAIIRNPKVIIFDEATSALDSVTEREIQAAIDNLTKDRTTFMIAHRLSTIKNADKIAVIKDGKCVEFGTYDELMEKKGEFYNYKQMQS